MQSFFHVEVILGLFSHGEASEKGFKLLSEACVFLIIVILFDMGCKWCHKLCGAILIARVSGLIHKFLHSGMLIRIVLFLQTQFVCKSFEKSKCCD